MSTNTESLCCREKVSDEILNGNFLHFRSSPPEVILEKGILNKCRKFTNEDTRLSVISIKLLSKHIFHRTPLMDSFCRF